MVFVIRLKLRQYISEETHMGTNMKNMARIINSGKSEVFVKCKRRNTGFPSKTQKALEKIERWNCV